MKTSSKFLSIVIIVVFAVLLFYFFGTPKPTVTLTPDGGPIAPRKQLTIKLDVSRGNLKKLVVTAVQGEKRINVLTKDYPAARQATETFDLAQAGLQEGPLTLQVKATSSATYFGADRTRTQDHSFTFENKPPVVSVLSIAHNIRRGGSALVVYTVNKEVENTGVVFADRFVPGYRQEGGFYACLFPFPWNMDPNQYVPKVMAVDRAGNERVVTINYHLITVNFPTDRITITEKLLDKIKAEFSHVFPQTQSPLELFLKVNRERRQQDRDMVYQLGRQTAPTPIWQGDFLRMQNSAPLGGFAQTRTYIHEGKEVDQQTHLGFDLASLAQAPVPAANRGKVIFADDMGLYGLCVIIDHGIGLQTLYGHLSKIGVKTGDTVEKGQIIANTGATGMALGDHLHFEVVVAGYPVNPIEWWDSSWIKNNVTGKLEMARASVAK